MMRDARFRMQVLQMKSQASLTRRPEDAVPQSTRTANVRPGVYYTEDLSSRPCHGSRNVLQGIPEARYERDLVDGRCYRG